MLAPRLLHLIEDLIGDWRRLDERIDNVSLEIETLAEQDGALILARLYGPEHYPTLKKRYAPIFAPLIPDIKKRTMRLISHLDGSEKRKPG